MSVGGVSYQMSHLLDKMMSTDKDFRFMATNDLMMELQKDSIKLDDDSERKVVRMLLKLLEDKNGEVQNLAVRCLAPLVSKVKDYHVEGIVESLCNNMVGDKETLRDISSIGLKTVINELPLSNSNLVSSACRTMVGRLMEAVKLYESRDISVQLEALDILGDLLCRFGTHLSSYHFELRDTLLPQLKSSRLAVRKRSILSLSHLLASSSNPSFYSTIIDFLVTELEKADSPQNVRTIIQALGAICRIADHRFSDHVSKVITLVLKYSKVEDDDETLEYVLCVCENTVLKCGKEVSPFIPQILSLCLTYISYDPNYNYEESPLNSDETMEWDDGENEKNRDRGKKNNGDENYGDNNEDDDEEEEEEEEYSDDDDISWKVRRSAAKCLEALLSTRMELMDQFYDVVSPILMTRFKEREENVKADIFHAYKALIKVTKTPKALSSLSAQVPVLVKSVSRLLKDKSIKTRQGVFQLLSEVMNVVSSALSLHIPSLLSGILFSLGDKQSSSTMKIDTLSFIHHLLQTFSGSLFAHHTEYLLQALLSAVSDSFYKISSEALLVLETFVRVFPSSSSSSSETQNDGAVRIYNVCFLKLQASDIDQEVKERAISCMGQILGTLGHQLSSHVPQCLPYLLERLNNEITRITAVKALTKIAETTTPSPLDLTSILKESLSSLTSFLRKNQRVLKLSALLLLDALVKIHVKEDCSSHLSSLLEELSLLLTDTDLHVSQLTLVLLTSIAKAARRLSITFPNSTLSKVFLLSRSSLLQGGALTAMLDFLKALVGANLAGMSQGELLRGLVESIMQPSGASIHKQGRSSLAKCVAAIAMTNSDSVNATVKEFMRSLLRTSPPPHEQIFSLLAIGEIGRVIDCSAHTELKAIVLNSFNDSSEEVKSAASYALGNLSLGNLKEYLPIVLQEIETRPKRQYLLLHSLKEIISAQMGESSEIFDSHSISLIWKVLYEHCECPEEGTRNVVAECMGKLCLISPNDALPDLAKSLDSPSPLVRTTVVTALKFTISDTPQKIDEQLLRLMAQFLKPMSDPDLNVRRVALITFNSIAHNKHILIKDLLDTVLPQLYQETQKRKDLIREVEMGPFKHEVDNGLDLRKAAFECMYTLLDKCVDKLDIYVFLSFVEDGLKDHYDIKMLTYLMVARVSVLCPTAVLVRLDKLVEPLKVTVTTKVKANSVKQEYEKQDELKRSAMRAVGALLSIPGADKHIQLNEFMTHIKNTPELITLFESIQRDSSPTGGSLHSISSEPLVPMEMN